MTFLWRRSGEKKIKVPPLTREAAKLSKELLALDEVGRLRCADTIRDIISGIRNLGAMPDEVVSILWGLLVTIARKAVMGADPDVLMKEVEAGLDPTIREMIMERVRR